MAVANFHFHTIYSDGQCTPTEVVKLMYNHGYDILIKADHDTVEGCAETKHACDALNIECFAGIELTARIDSDIMPEIGDSYALHILGLGIDYYLMRAELAKLHAVRSDSLNKLAELLIADGFALRRDVLYNRREYIAEHSSIARELVEIGRAQDVTDAYASILNRARYADYSAMRPSSSEAIDMIHRSGGLAVLAHPLTLKKGGSITLERSAALSIIKRLVSYNLDGIECYYLRYDNDNIAFLSSVADELGLLKSIGSDLHTRSQVEILSNRHGDAAAYMNGVYPLINKLTSLKLAKNIK